MEEITGQTLTGERALFNRRDILVKDCVFENGESPIKECRDIEITGCAFKWKYPLWYCRDIEVRNTVWHEMARAGVWYTRDIEVSDCQIDAPKNFRRCRDLSLKNVKFSNAAETLWHCWDVSLENISADKADYFAMDSQDLEIKDITINGNYFAMNAKDITVDNLTLNGNYGFDGCENATIRSCRLITKDAFWNTKNVTVYDSYISGEYLGWNSKNLTFINCTIESLQGLCYIENLHLINCKLVNTTLAFEYCTVKAEINGRVDSILNPTSGKIQANEIGELIIESDKVNPDDTKIICPKIEKRSDRPEWLR